MLYLSKWIQLDQVMFPARNSLFLDRSVRMRTIASLFSLAWLIGGCSSGISDVALSQADGCYALDGVPILALRNRELFLPSQRTPIAQARHRRLRSGTFLEIQPEVRIRGDRHLVTLAPNTHRLIPVQTESTIFTSHVRILLPKIDGFGFEVLYKHTERTC